MTRCFVALWPPDAVRGEIDRAAAALVPPDCRRVPAANLHLTLCFIGGVADDRLPALARVVERVPVPPFALELSVTGAFPEARVAWLAPRRTPPALVELHARMAAALRDHGFDVEARASRPHVTLARSCRAALRPWPGPPVAWRVDHAVLCRSDGTDDGVRYSVIARTAVASVR